MNNDNESMGRCTGVRTADPLRGFSRPQEALSDGLVTEKINDILARQGEIESLVTRVGGGAQRALERLVGQGYGIDGGERPLPSDEKDEPASLLDTIHYSQARTLSGLEAVLNMISYF